MATIGEFVIDLTFLIIFETSSISSPTSSPTLATWGHERFSSYAATLQFSNFFIIYSKSSSTEPTRLTTIGTSSFGSIIFAKVGLGKSDYLATVEAAVSAGVDAITAINTVRAMAIDVETQMPILSNKIGGLSGTPIKPIALRCVYEIASKFDIPIMGCGGISTWEDAVEFILAGSSAVQFGSVMGDHWVETFAEINSGIQNYMEKKNYKTIGEMVGKAKRS